MRTSTHAVALTGLIAVVLVTSVAAADDHFQPRPGTRGTVTAYEADGRTVIQVRACAWHHGGHDYTTCGSLLRSEVHATLCARGKGTHPWVYQVSDGARLPSTAFCR